jgi:hypothetical protein
LFPELAELLDALLDGLSCLTTGDQVGARQAVSRANLVRTKIGHMMPPRDLTFTPPRTF